jgi:GAF domain-containing protein
VKTDLTAAAEAFAVVQEMERRFQALVNAVIPIGVSLLGAKNFPRMLETILVEAKTLCRADGGTIYLRNEGDGLEFAIVRNDSIGIAFGGTTGAAIPFAPLPLCDPSTGEPNLHNVATYVANTGSAVNIPDAYTAEGFEFSGTVTFDRQTGYRSRSFLTVPLRNQSGKVIGVLQLLNARDPDSGEVIPFDPGFQPVVESLSTLAAAALEVYLREENLRRQIETLHIQIDEAKRERHVTQITESDYFRRLQTRARELRRGG